MENGYKTSDKEDMIQIGLILLEDIMKNRYLPYLLPFRCVVLQFFLAVRPKNRLFWGQFASGHSRSSEKPAVLGTIRFRP